MALTEVAGSPGHTICISAFTAPSTDLLISTDESLQLAKVNLTTELLPETSVNFTFQLDVGTSTILLPLAPPINAPNPIVDVLHSSLVKRTVPDILLSGAPVYVTTPPFVVGSLKIGCETKTLAF